MKPCSVCRTTTEEHRGHCHFGWHRPDCLFPGKNWPIYDSHAATNSAPITNPILLLSEHIASLSDDNEDVIYDRISSMITEGLFIGNPRPTTPSYDVADLALRTCQCGFIADGFYEYIDHLKDVFEKAIT